MNAQDLIFLVLGALVGFGIRPYLTAYASEKGKNLATREDIQEVTDKVEEVKTQYLMLVEQFKTKNQLRLAALDDRLRAHQDAFVLWRKLIRTAHSEEVVPVVAECQVFWESRCLYLEPDARAAFSNAYFHASSHRTLVQSGQGLTPDKRKELIPLIEGNWKWILDAGKIILESVALPALSDVEAKSLSKLVT